MLALSYTFLSERHEDLQAESVFSYTSSPCLLSSGPSAATSSLSTPILVDHKEHSYRPGQICLTKTTWILLVAKQYSHYG